MLIPRFPPPTMAIVSNVINPLTAFGISNSTCKLIEYELMNCY